MSTFSQKELAKLIEKLIKLTQNGELKWSFFSHPGLFSDNFYESNYEGGKIRITESIFRSSSLKFSDFMEFDLFEDSDFSKWHTKKLIKELVKSINKSRLELARKKLAELAN
jgi:hypothetical protein